MRLFGDIALMTAGIGIIVFAVLYLTLVKWWTDPLGRSIAFVVGSIAAIMVVVVVRVARVDVPHIIAIRAVLFVALAASIWLGVGAFVWAQFVAPRIRPKTRERIDDAKRKLASMASTGRRGAHGRAKHGSERDDE